jgi:methyltransferase
MTSQGFTGADSDGSYQVMVAVHTLWIVCTGLEAFYTPLSMPGLLVALAVVVFAAAQFLRIAAIRTLGKQWNTRVMTTELTADAHRVVAAGPYRYVRHPNYVAVILEFASLPLIGGAILTALIGSIANLLVVRHRVLAEEACLFKRPGYAAAFSDIPRFIPRIRLIK